MNPPQGKVVAWSAEPCGDQFAEINFGEQKAFMDTESAELLIAAHNAEVSALQAEIAKREWMPIETAPKDGSRVVVWSEDRGITTAFFDAGSCAPGWVVFTDSLHVYDWIEPVMWMRLQPPTLPCNPSQNS